MKRILLPIFALTLSATLPLRAGILPSDPDALLDEVLRHPGAYSQVCDVNLVHMPAPFNAWDPIAYGEAGLSKKKIAALQASRAALIPALVKRLEQVDLTRPAIEVPPDKHPDESMDGDGTGGVGVDPKAYSNLLLLIIVKLDAIETLPALLAVEDKLHDAVLRLEKDPSSPFPEMDGFDDASISSAPTPEEENDTRDWDAIPEAEKQQREHRSKICQIQVAHRDTLAVIGHLLRLERNPAILASAAEKQYQKALRKEVAESEDLKTYKTPSDIPEDQREYTYFDPIANIPRNRWFKVEVPYTEALRNEILKAARARKAN